MSDAALTGMSKLLGNVVILIAGSIVLLAGAIVEAKTGVTLSCFTRSALSQRHALVASQEGFPAID